MFEWLFGKRRSSSTGTTQDRADGGDANFHVTKARLALQVKQAQNPAPQELREQLLKNIVYYSRQTQMYFDIYCWIGNGSVRSPEELSQHLRASLAMIHESGYVPQTLSAILRGTNLPNHLRPLPGWKAHELSAAYLLGNSYTSALSDAAAYFVESGRMPEVVLLFQEQLLQEAAGSLGIRSIDTHRVFGAYSPSENFF